MQQAQKDYRCITHARRVTFIVVRTGQEKNSWLSFHRQAVVVVGVQTLYSGTLNIRQKARLKVNHPRCNSEHEATALPARNGEFLLPRKQQRSAALLNEAFLTLRSTSAAPASKTRPVLHRACGGHWDQLPGDSLAHVSLIWTRVGKQG